MPTQSSAYAFHIREASWEADNASLSYVRKEVFICEQHVPVELEWDGEDHAAVHLLAEDNQGHPVGTARMLKDGHIGRVAVLKPWRSRGVGTAIMKRLLHMAKQRGESEVFLDAQIDALPFYLELGFKAEGEIFLDANIPHRHMRYRFKEEQHSKSQ